jgi:hypothetical protein
MKVRKFRYVKNRDRSSYGSVCRRIILKISTGKNVVWVWTVFKCLMTGSIGLRVGTGGGLL